MQKRVQRRDFLKVAAAVPLLGYTLGKPDKEPKVPLVYDKFVKQLRDAGINVAESSTHIGTVKQYGKTFNLCMVELEDGSELICGASLRLLDIYDGDGELSQLLCPGATVELVEKIEEQTDEWYVIGRYWEINNVFYRATLVPATSVREFQNIQRQIRETGHVESNCPNCHNFWLRDYPFAVRHCPYCGTRKPWSDPRLS